MTFQGVDGFEVIAAPDRLYAVIQEDSESNTVSICSSPPNLSTKPTGKKSNITSLQWPEVL
jgi:hypothetical protein